MDIPEDLARAAASAPLYAPLIGGKSTSSLRSLSVWPPVDLEGLLRAHTDLNDPFGGRLHDGAGALTMFQMGDQLPLYWALLPNEMAAAAEVLAECWSTVGIRQGDRVAIYDYGTSPLTLFASANYIPHLPTGAAEILGCTPICNDGLPEFASRVLHVLRYVRPQVLFVRGDVMPALVSQATKEDVDFSSLTSLLVVSSDEELADPGDTIRWSRQLGVTVTQLLRVDAALFFAHPCQLGDAYHPNDLRYIVEAVSERELTPVKDGDPGRLTITNLFLRTCPAIRYVSDIRARVRRIQCDCGHQGTKIMPAE